MIGGLTGAIILRVLYFALGFVLGVFVMLKAL